MKDNDDQRLQLKLSYSSTLTIRMKEAEQNLTDLQVLRTKLISTKRYGRIKYTENRGADNLP